MELSNNKTIKKPCCNDKDNRAARSRGITSIESYCKKCGYVYDIKSICGNYDIIDN